MSVPHPLRCCGFHPLAVTGGRPPCAPVVLWEPFLPTSQHPWGLSCSCWGAPLLGASSVFELGAIGKGDPCTSLPALPLELCCGPSGRTPVLLYLPAASLSHASTTSAHSPVVFEHGALALLLSAQPGSHRVRNCRGGDIRKCFPD